MMKDSAGLFLIFHGPSSRVYIGYTSLGLAQRIREDRARLRAGTHICRPLQEAWLAGQESDFRFEAIAFGPHIDLKSARRTWMFQYAGRLFNSIGKPPKPVLPKRPRPKRAYSERTAALMRARALRRWSDPASREHWLAAIRRGKSLAKQIREEDRSERRDVELSRMVA